MSNFIKEVLGFDPWGDSLRSIQDLASCTYPKYNMVKNDDGSWHLEIAVAGFSKKDISVEERNNTLIIEGKSGSDVRKYLHKGISTKPFKLLFPLSVDWKLKQASLFDGILRFTFVTKEPEQSNKIEITTDAPAQLQEIRNETD